jgi:hypothetical protein
MQLTGKQGSLRKPEAAAGASFQEVVEPELPNAANIPNLSGHLADFGDIEKSGKNATGGICST